MKSTHSIPVFFVFCFIASMASPAFGEVGEMIGVTEKESVSHWPERRKVAANAPNVLLILLDDVGFGDAGTFGGLAQTPVLDGLAAGGLRYNNFHTTGMCSPTRAALLTGHNHHRVGFGRITNIPGGFPGYDCVWKPSSVPLAEVLRRNGYRTTAFGKWHNTPEWEISPAGPFDRWPTGLGFEHFYGIMEGADDQWNPLLYRDTTPIDPPARPEEGYHFTADLVNQAIKWIHTHGSVAPEQPYFLYLATGAMHEPHHAPKNWIEKCRGRFDQGWDKTREAIFARQKALGVIPTDTLLTPRPDGLPAWDSLSKDEQRLYARQMEVYAAFLEHTDSEIGRLLDAARGGPRGDNTLVIYIVGDNGSAGMGGLEGREAGNANVLSRRLGYLDELGGRKHRTDYATGWAWAGTTPFQWMKGTASHFGATRNPMVVSWPGHIRGKGGLRSQFTHVNDVAPTIYELSGVAVPAAIDGISQEPLDGTSFAYTFADGRAPSRHTLQYFEMWGNRAIYKDGWMASAFHHLPWAGWRVSEDFSSDRWELYQVSEDFSQARDLAGKHPDILAEMRALFDSEARRNHVYPLGFNLARVRAEMPRFTGGRRQFVYHPGMPPLLVGTAAPSLMTSSFRISAEATLPSIGVEGVILSYGGVWGGLVLYIKDQRLVLENNFGSATANEIIVSDQPIHAGKVRMAFELDRGTLLEDGSSGGTGRLFLDDRLVGEAKLRRFVAWGSMGIGRSFGTSVSPAFESPFALGEGLETVTVTLKDPPQR